MTKREFFVKVAAGEMTEEMQAMAAEFLVKMDETLEKRKMSEKVQAQRNANVALATRIATEILGAEAMTASDVAARIEELGWFDEPIKVQKASSLCRKAVELELAVQTDVKIPKKGSQKAYTAVQA